MRAFKIVFAALLFAATLIVIFLLPTAFFNKYIFWIVCAAVISGYCFSQILINNIRGK